MRVDAAHGDLAPGHRRGERPGAADDPVADHPVLGGLQRVDAVDRERRACRRPRSSRPSGSSIAARSTISGSRAALSITVVPSASTAAIRMFSVAPTLGKSSQICAPRSTLAARDDPAVLDLRGGAEPLQARLVHVQRPRADGVAAGQRDLGPPAPRRSAGRARTPRPAAATPPVVRLGAELARARRSPRRRARRSTPQPRPRSTSAISGTSRISGQFVSVVVPSASSAAAISFSTLFLAPTTSTEPDKPGSAGHRESSATDGRRYLLVPARVTVPPWPCT